MQLESDRFTNPLEGVDEATFSIEREVVRNELRQRNETGFAGQAWNWIQEAVFPADHPYHHGIAGSHESLSSITLDDARRFAAQHYRPDNMTMLVIGDVALETAPAFVQTHLSPALYGDPQKPAAPVAPRLPTLAAPVPQVKPTALRRCPRPRSGSAGRRRADSAARSSSPISGRRWSRPIPTPDSSPTIRTSPTSPSTPTPDRAPGW